MPLDKRYPISAYDKYLCLRLSFELWVIMIFLLRPLLVTLLSILSREDKTAIINLVYSNRLAIFPAVIAAVPAAMVIYAWAKRVPGASERVRSIWRNGRKLLVISTILNIALIVGPVMAGWTGKLNNFGWGQLGLCVAVLAYLLLSPRVKDTFADFPAPEKLE